MCFLPEVQYKMYFSLEGVYFKELQLKDNLFYYPYICRDHSYIYHQQKLKDNLLCYFKCSFK